MAFKVGINTLHRHRICQDALDTRICNLSWISSGTAIHSTGRLVWSDEVILYRNVEESLCGEENSLGVE